MAREFLRLGHKVAGCGRTGAIAEQLTQEFNLIADRCNFAAVDVIQDQEVKQWAAQVLRKFGPPDVLINNAAIAGRHMNFWELPAEEFNRVVDVDIKGPANTTRHFVPQMISAGKGVVCNVSSWVGRREEWARKVCPAVLGIDRSMNGELLETWKSGLKCALYVDENGSLKLDDREYTQ